MKKKDRTCWWLASLSRSDKSLMAPDIIFTLSLIMIMIMIMMLMMKIANQVQQVKLVRVNQRPVSWWTSKIAETFKKDLPLPPKSFSSSSSPDPHHLHNLRLGLGYAEPRVGGAG